MKQVIIDFDEAARPISVMAAFMNMVLLKEGKSNFMFNLSCLLLGRKNAVRLYFKKIFNGCDFSTYLHHCEQFSTEHLTQLINPSVEKEIAQAVRCARSVFVKFNGTGEVITPYLQRFGKPDIKCTYRADIKQANILSGRIQ